MTQPQLFDSYMPRRNSIFQKSQSVAQLFHCFLKVLTKNAKIVKLKGFIMLIYVDKFWLMLIDNEKILYNAFDIET